MSPIIIAVPFVIHAFITNETPIGHDLIMAWSCNNNVRMNRNHNQIDRIGTHKPTGHRVTKLSTSDNPVAMEAAVAELMRRAIRDCSNVS